MEKQQQTDRPVQNRRRFFTRPTGIVIIAVAAFVLGNFVGTGKLSINLFNHAQYAAVSGLPSNLDYKSIESVYDTLRENYDGKLTEQQVMDGLKQGLAESTGDPYTEYFTAKKAQAFYGDLNNSFSGIGAELSQDSDKNIVVVSPIAGFPAEKAGIKPQDIITSINGTTTSGMTVNDAVAKIRGEIGSKVTIQVVRDKSEQLSFTITRETIKLESVKTQMLDDNIGYISISTFADDTSDLMAKAAKDMKAKNVKGIILDLRGNPGGLLDAAVNVSSQWLPSGKKILDEKRGGKVVVDSYASQGPATLEGIPTVVLLNEGSASASEITAGALHDNNAARIIGVKSYGKGVVQQTICVSGARSSDGNCNGDMLKVTVASWFRPNGQNINHQGIKPDQEVKLSDDDAKAGNDTQKSAAIDYLKSKQ